MGKLIKDFDTIHFYNLLVYRGYLDGIGNNNKYYNSSLCNVCNN